MKPTKKIEAEIRKVHETFWDTYLRGDLKTMGSLFADSLTLIGTSEGEMFTNKKSAMKYIKATIKQIAGVVVRKNVDLRISLVDDTVIVTEFFDAYIIQDGKEAFYGKWRGTAILRKVGGKWKYIHQHGSVPDSMAEVGETLGAKRVREENRELRLAVKRHTKELEQSNRELEIEASLERVRARAMAMQSSSELSDLIGMIYTELGRLDVSLDRCFIMLFDEASGDATWWMASNKNALKRGYHLPYHKNPPYLAYLKAWKRRDRIWKFLLKGAEKKRWDEFIFSKTELAEFPKREIKNMKAVKAAYTTASFNRYGCITTGTLEPLSLQSTELLARFSRMFEQTYTRFLDLKRAEAQARESQIEAALEKIRSRSLAMHNSNELRDVIGVVYKQLNELGVVRDTIALQVFDFDKKESVFWPGNNLSAVAPKVMLPYDKAIVKEDTCHRDLWKAMSTGKSIFNKVYTKKQKERWFKYVFAHNGLDVIPEHARKFILKSNSHTVCFIPQKYSGLFVDSFDGRVYTEEEFSVLNRTAKVFEQAYIRFLDLQKAESQARESEIQLALERVRARTMAMQKSEELNDVAILLFQQVAKLGIKTWTTGFNVWSDKNDYYTDYITSPQGNSIKSYKIDATKFSVFIDVAKARKSGVDFWISYLEGDLLKETYKRLSDSAGEGQYEKMLEDGFQFPSHQYNHFVFGSKVSLMFITYEPVPDAHDIFKRFGKVFEQTYTRFIDLQKAEALAREAQIESALEKVRSTSLAMHHSDELEKVISVLFEKLEDLGVSFDGALIFTFDRAKKNIEFWVHSNTLEAPIKLNLPFNDAFSNNAIFIDLWRAIENGGHQLNKKYSGKTKNEFYIHLSQANSSKIPQMDVDSILAAESWTFTFSAEKNSIIGFDSWSGYLTSEENFQILRRFSRVFEQAYVRFLDLQKAEAQAREAQIEAALEKVRARTMGMQRSDELAEAAVLMFQQVRSFGLELWGCGFNIWDKNDKECTTWMSDPQGQLAPPFKIPLTESPVFIQFYESRQAGIDFYVDELQGERLAKNYEYMATLPVLGDEMKRFLSSGGKNPTYQVDHVVNFSHGNLIFITYKQVPEAHDMFKRFGKVFEQTYTRFLDLQRAESQAREGQIQLALERLRARTMAMHYTLELSGVAEVLFAQLKQLGAQLWGCGFNICKPDDDYVERWMCRPDGKMMEPLLIPISVGPFERLMYDAWKNRDELITYEQEGAELKEGTESLKLHPSTEIIYKRILELTESQVVPVPTYLKHYVSAFQYGYVWVMTTEPFEETQIFVRFAKVFEQTYTRFLDLKRAEQQARESQIEAALERVRSRTMAMHKSEELLEVITVVCEQLLHVGLKFGTVSFGKNSDSFDMDFWVAGPDLKLPIKMSAPYRDISIYQRLKAAHTAKKNFFTDTFNADEIKVWYQHVIDHNPELFSQKSQDYLLSRTAMTRSAFILKNVILFVINHDIVTYSDEENEILMRFAKVFEQAYTRFVDLQKAEAQAREAQIEASLERLRARTMAMQRSNELAEVSQLLLQQFTSLGVEITTCAFMFPDEEKKAQSGWTVLPDGTLLPRLLDFPLIGDDVLDERYESWKHKKPLHRRTLNVKENRRHHQFLSENVASHISKDVFTKLPEEQLTFTSANFAQGYLMIFTSAPLPEEHENILVRFAKVFEQTYTRFLDLQRAEAQARESQIEAALERVRSKTMAMQKSDDLQNVTAVLYDQLKQLRFTNGVSSITIIDATTGDFDTWAEGFADGYKFLQKHHINYIDHPVHRAQIEHWKSGSSFAAVTATGESKRALDFYLFYETDFKNAPESTKELMMAQESVTWSMAYMQYGCLLWAPTPISDEQAKILQRFAKVFEQTYTRFLDLQKAEAQAKEAQIQLALERVRARTMAMHHSSDVRGVAVAISDQLKHLGFENGSCTIALIDGKTGDMEWWMGGFDERRFQESYYIKNFDHPAHRAMIDAFNRHEKIICIPMSGESKRTYDDGLFIDNGFANIPDQVKAWMRSLETAEFTLAFNKHGGLHWGTEKLTNEQIEILQRFAGVFEQSYTRFLDLKNAEALAREAQIEAALEKIRSRSLAMHHSGELKEVAAIMFEKLKELNVIIGTVGIHLFDQSTMNSIFWAGNSLHDEPPRVKLPFDEKVMNEDGYMKDAWAAKKRNDNIINREYTHEQKVKFFDYIFASNELDIIAEADREIIRQNVVRPAGNYVICLINEQNSSLFADSWDGQLYSDDKVNVLVRAAKVFEQAYVRFLDLQKAEAQARESQIEAALERVRSRTMAMHKSEELLNVIVVVSQQLTQLGFRFDVVSFARTSEVHDYKFWFCMEKAEQAFEINVPYLNSPMFERVKDAIARGEKFYADILTVDENREWITHMLAHDAWPGITDQVKDFLLNRGYARSIVIMPQIMLLLGNYFQKPYSDEQNNILKRFAAVFEQSYTRFLDLQKAEAQAREAQIEAALERVRAKAMAMHSAQQLNEVVHELRKQFGSLGPRDLDTCVIHLNDESPESIQAWAAIKIPGKDDEIKVFSTPVPKRGLQIIEEGLANYYSGKSDYVLLNDGAKLMEWGTFVKTQVPGAFALLNESSGNDLESARAYWSFADFQGGSLIMVTLGEPVETSRTLLRRFANVFGLAYRRFADLKQAEAQAREAQIETALERVRAKAMAMHTAQQLKEVVHELRHQLGLLELRDLETCVIQLSEESPDFIHSWAAVRPPGREDEIKEFFALIPKRGLKIVEEWLSEYSSGKQDYVLKNEGEKLRQWFEEFIKLYPEAFDTITDSGKTRLDDLRSYWSFADFQGGSLLMVTYAEPDESSRLLLRRFANVFGLAYRRFADLKQAEAQARESQIEAALERVRSKTMAMQRSEQLGETAILMFEQIKSLGITPWSVGFNVWADDNDSYVDWMANPGGGFIEPYKVDVSRHQVFRNVAAARKSGLDFFVSEQSGAQAEEVYRLLNDEGEYQKILDSGFTFPTRQFSHFVFGEKVSLLFITYEPCPEYWDVFKRFGKVFEQTYTRFLDLKKAEAQAREATIEAALEKIRSRSLGMHKSEEILDVVAILFEKLKELGLIFDGGAAIHLFAEGSKDASILVMAPQLTEPIRNRLPYDEAEFEGNPIVRDIWKAKDTGENIINKHYTFEEKDKYFSYLFKYNSDVMSESVMDFIRSAKSYTANFIAEKNSLLGASSWTGQEFSEDDVDVLKRVARVFELSYVRFLDLQKAELQAREATIEAALEKIRSRSLGMRQSSELNEVVIILFEKLKELDLPFDGGAGLYLFSEGSRDTHFWVTNGRVSPVCNYLPYDENDFRDNPVLQDIWKARDNGQPIINRHYSSEDKDKLFAYTSKHNDSSKIPESERSFVSEASSYTATLIPERNSLLSVDSWTKQMMAPADVEVLKRFARVFEQAYVRFLDLQKAEVHAKEAVRQASLDRIRAEIASMRTVQDLDRITPLIWTELTTIGIPFIRCGVFIMDAVNREVKTFLSTPDGKAIAVFQLPFDLQGRLGRIVPSWQNRKMFLDYWNEAAMRESADTLVSRGVFPTAQQYLDTLPKEGFHLHFLPFEQGMLYVGNLTRLKDEELSLLQSLAEAFATAYARYDDFNKLEEAKLQVDNALIELKQAQQQLVQSEKMASLGELTAGIAHEIQNPLNFVNNFSEVSNELIEEMTEELKSGNIQAASEIAESIRQNLEKITHHGKRADGIVKGMLQHSRTGSGQKEATNINVLCDEYLRLAYHGYRAKDKTFNAKFETDFDPALPKVSVIPQDIGRVTLNLINNAFYAVTEKSKLKIEGYAPCVKVSTCRSNDRIEIRVKDNGNGIPDSIREKIFQPFFTTKPTGQGTGLGLSLSYDIIKAHGGTLEVSSKEGEGSEFLILLPVLSI